MTGRRKKFTRGLLQTQLIQRNEAEKFARIASIVARRTGLPLRALLPGNISLSDMRRMCAVYARTEMSWEAEFVYRNADTEFALRRPLPGDTAAAMRKLTAQLADEQRKRDMEEMAQTAAAVRELMEMNGGRWPTIAELMEYESERRKSSV